MQVFKVHISPSVIDEIEYYVDVIAQDSLPNAVKWYGEIMDKIKTLSQFPSRCPYADEIDRSFYRAKPRYKLYWTKCGGNVRTNNTPFIRETA